MTTLLRLVIYAVVGYIFFLTRFPAWRASGYHVVQFLEILAGAVAVFLAIKLVDIGSKLAKWAIEAGFAALVFFYLGATLPRTTPQERLDGWIERHAPSRKDVASYLVKAGINPDSSVGKEFLSHWPGD